GMVAYRVEGIVNWHWGFVVASVVCGVVFTSLAFATQCSDNFGPRRVMLATGLLVVAITTLHFTAMTAMSIIPLAPDAASPGNDHMASLALATALVGLIVICAGVAAAFLDRQARSDAMQRLHNMAMHDALTGLPNRVSFREKLLHQIGLARAANEKF